jgi:hypothetical protein
MFYDVERPFERIFYILDIQKSDFDGPLSDVLSRRMVLRNHNLISGRLNDFGEVGKAMFQSVELIFRILCIEKSLNDVLNRRKALRTLYMPSEPFKIRLW